MQRIFRFSGAECDWTGSTAKAKTMLGGKGAGLVMMAKAQMPVPPGFTITTAVCKEFEVSLAPKKFMNDLMWEAEAYDTWLGQQFGYYPLVSIRSGAPVSMPGMMDTILNVGITETTLPEWAERLGGRAAFDSYRRLIQMLGSTAYGVPHQLFEDALAHRKQVAGVTEDWQLTTAQLGKLITTYLAEFMHHTGHEFPQTRREENADDEKSFDITEKEAVEILPDVFVSAGDLFQNGIIRAVIDAPRSILILRGDNFREGVNHAT